MYMTVLSGHVNQENWSHLHRSYERLCRKPPSGMVETILTQSIEDPTLWQIISLWSSAETYYAAEHQQRTAPCEQLFCGVGSAPVRASFNLITRYLSISAYQPVSRS